MDPLQQGHLVHSSVDGRGAGALEYYIYYTTRDGCVLLYSFRLFIVFERAIS